jgi:hypothetical protein
MRRKSPPGINARLDAGANAVKVGIETGIDLPGWLPVLACHSGGHHGRSYRQRCAIIADCWHQVFRVFRQGHRGGCVLRDGWINDCRNR